MQKHSRTEDERPCLEGVYLQHCIAVTAERRADEWDWLYRIDEGETVRGGPKGSLDAALGAGMQAAVAHIDADRRAAA